MRSPVPRSEIDQDPGHDYDRHDMTRHGLDIEEIDIDDYISSTTYTYNIQ